VWIAMSGVHVFRGKCMKSEVIFRTNKIPVVPSHHLFGNGEIKCYRSLNFSMKRYNFIWPGQSIVQLSLSWKDGQV
jgi:hypothetical protein